jgi:hypothetical protein
MVKNISYYLLSISNLLNNNKSLTMDNSLESQIPSSMLSKLAKRERIETKAKSLPKRKNLAN